MGEQPQGRKPCFKERVKNLKVSEQAHLPFWPASERKTEKQNSCIFQIQASDRWSDRLWLLVKTVSWERLSRNSGKEKNSISLKEKLFYLSL